MSQFKLLAKGTTNFKESLDVTLSTFREIQTLINGEEPGARLSEFQVKIKTAF
jgi:hypothetical protein